MYRDVQVLAGRGVGVSRRGYAGQGSCQAAQHREGDKGEPGEADGDGDQRGGDRGEGERGGSGSDRQTCQGRYSEGPDERQCGSDAQQPAAARTCRARAGLAEQVLEPATAARGRCRHRGAAELGPQQRQLRHRGRSVDVDLVFLAEQPPQLSR